MSARTSAAILVIDNDPIQLTGTAAVLNMAGYECWCARDREAAMKAARTQPLDLILCDVQLGKESGLDLCRDLRTIPGCDDIPVMFASNSQLPDVIRRSSEMGSAYFLRKPFDPDVLIELVGKAMWMPHLVSARLNQVSAHKVPMPQDDAPATSVPAPKGIAGRSSVSAS